MPFYQLKIYNYQSGFRGNHSTNLCFSFLTDKVLRRFDKGLLTGMILIYLQKAFDTIAGFELAVRNSQFVTCFGCLRMSFCIFSKICESLKSDTS